MDQRQPRGVWSPFVFLPTILCCPALCFATRVSWLDNPTCMHGFLLPVATVRWTLVTVLPIVLLGTSLDPAPHLCPRTATLLPQLPIGWRRGRGGDGIEAGQRR